MMKLMVACGAVLLPFAACGGSDDDSSAEDPTTTEALPAEDDAASDTEDEGSSEATMPPESDDDGGDDSGDSGESGGSGPSTATATINGETYEFSTEGAVVAQCLTDMFGIFSVQLPGLDGDSGISIVALQEGTDPEVVGEVNSVEVDIGDDRWVADEASDLFGMVDTLQPGMSQVESVEIDGSTVRGTATFVRDLSLFDGGEPETTTGTFEATCGEERTS